MLEGVAGAVHARRLAVPHAKNAIVESAGEQVGLLAAPDGGGGEVLVQAFLEDDVAGRQVLAGAVRLLVQAAQGRATIAGNETGRLQARAGVQTALVKQHTEERLDTGDENATIFEQIFVVERHIRMAH